MTKYTALFLLIVLFQGFGQVSKSDTAVVSKTSQNLLGEKIDYVWKGGSMIQALEQLTKDHGLKFSYSGHKISNSTIKAQSFNDVTIDSILQTLLNDIGYDYMVVGSIIVIVKKENNDLKKPSTDTISNTTSDASINNQPYSPHVYTPQTSITGLSWLEQLVIRRTFKKELKWSFEQNKKQSKDSIDPVYNSLEKDIFSQKYYILGALGIDKSFFRYKNNSINGWKDKLGYKQTTTLSVLPEISVGHIHKHFMFAVGLSYKRINTISNWSEVRDRRGEDEIVIRSSDEKYNILSIPMQGIFYKRFNNFYAGAGVNIQTHIMTARSESRDKFRRYYEDSVERSRYEYKTYGILLSSSLLITAGYVHRDNMLLFSSLEYNSFLSPVSKNSLVSVYPHSVILKLGFAYLFDL